MALPLKGGNPYGAGGNRAPWPLVSRRNSVLLSGVEGTHYYWESRGQLSLLFRVVGGVEGGKHSPDIRSSGLSVSRYLVVTY